MALAETSASIHPFVDMNRTAIELLCLLMPAVPARAAVVRVEVAPEASFGVAAPAAASGLAAPFLPTPPALTAPALPDMPPAGPRTSLDMGQVDWLRAQLVERPDAALAPAGFQAIILGRRGKAANVLPRIESDPDGVQTVLKAMYVSLKTVMDGDLAAEERGRIVYALNLRFAAFLDELVRRGRLPAAALSAIARSKSEFLAESVLLEELARHRQTSARATDLERSLLAGLAEGGSDTEGLERWRIGRPIPSSERGRSRRGEFFHSLSADAAGLEDVRLRLETLERRSRLAADGGLFSERLRRRVDAELAAFRAEALKKVRDILEWSVRAVSFTIPQSFLTPGLLESRTRRVAHIPDNKNLRLSVRDGEALISVRFETDLRDDEVLRTIRDSIEDYWRGEFSLDGRLVRLRTRVAIRKIPPGAPFSPGSLALTDSGGVTPHASASVIFFSHDLPYAVAAHEFGHILGLPDEYQEGYRPSGREIVIRADGASLMGARDGAVLPRHLRTVYRLLRRRSLN